MPPYPLYCFGRDCKRLALYKIASRWSDGITHELKTYALSCEECLPELYRRSREKQSTCRTVAGETLEPPGIFSLARGQRDLALARLPELEAKLAGTGEAVVP